MNTFYIQVFSMTDHTEPLQGRFQGGYKGINAELHTSEIDGSSLKISTKAVGPKGELDREALGSARAIVAYRHSDTGELQGTSETLIPIHAFPWTDLPGFEVREILKNEGVKVKLWNQELELKVDQVTRIRFMKTIVYLRNYGVIDNLVWSEDEIVHGPTQLHKEEINQELTLAPPGASGITVKAGQDTAD